MTILLIDGDIIAHRCAASIEPTKIKPEREEASLAIRRADELLYRILDSCQVEKHRIFLSGPDNFRHLIYPDYKANRRDKPRPQELDNVRLFLAEEWGATVCSGYEADDGIGIRADEDSIICSIDKDFNQIEGTHYNFVTSTFKTVDAEQAAMAFWLSMLVGDTSDNIDGIRGLGPVKASRILSPLDPSELEDAVKHIYDDDERFLLSYRLLRILRSEEEYERLLDETGIRKSEGEKSPEVGGTKDTGNLSGANPQ